MKTGVGSRPNDLTVLLRSDRDGGSGGPLAPLRPGGQPHVVQRVGVEPREDVLLGDADTPVVLLLGVGVVPVELVVDDVLSRVRRLAPLQSYGGFADVRCTQVAWLTWYTYKTLLGVSIIGVN